MMVTSLLPRWLSSAVRVKILKEAAVPGVVRPKGPVQVVGPAGRKVSMRVSSSASKAGPTLPRSWSLTTEGSAGAAQVRTGCWVAA